jgi:ATP-dependent Clp protease ATP-binding subunit ClpB
VDYLTRGSDYLKRFDGFELVGRDAELQRLIAILMRGRASSVILVGAGGVGCTALCLGIQGAKQQSDAPFDLVNKRLFWLDTNGLFAAGDNAATNRAFQNIIRRLRETTEPILLLDDTQDFLDACQRSGQTHFVNALLSMVRARQCQIILEVKDENLDGVLKYHSDVRELFTILPVDEPTGASLQLVVAAAAKNLATFHRIGIEPAAVTTAIELTNKWRGRDSGVTRAQPERAITLLDRSLATYRLAAHVCPPGYTVTAWEALRAELGRIDQTSREGERALADKQAWLDETAARERTLQTDGAGRFPAIGFDLPEVTKVKAEIVAIKGALTTNRSQYESVITTINAKLILTRDRVLTEFSDISGIPASKLDQNERDKLREMPTALRTRIFGQDAVLDRVAGGVQVFRLGRRNRNQPLAFLFLGPSGVGKTELAKVLAWFMLDDERALTRFDMSEYMEKHAVARLIGAPPGYEGFEAGGILTNAARNNPRRVFLFDEIEKAHPDVFNVFLQVLGDGRLTDGIGRTALFGDALIIMTTNIGQDHFLHDADAGTAEAAAFVELGNTYRSEFLNRFAGRQNILCFQKLDLAAMEKIVQREIADIDSTYREQGIAVRLDPASCHVFCEAQYDPTSGARGLPGVLNTRLETQIVKAILAGNHPPNTCANVTYDDAQHRFNVEFASG